jgi:non-ribosomal peptide synthetase component F
VGVPGEIHIGGSGVARGYAGRPELTSERFVGFDDGRRFYRTGDLGRWNEDGSISYLGRKDNQVKVRGQRIELGEIETVLTDHPAVRDGIVMACSAEGADSTSVEMVAYVEPEVDRADLRAHLEAHLPEVMVPRHVVTLPRLPRGATGKIDRAQLPEPEPAETEAGQKPASEVEEILARIWAEVLGVDEVGVTDDFFELGGDSIRSIRIIARAHEAGFKVGPRDFFENPTVRELAHIIEGAGS